MAQGNCTAAIRPFPNDTEIRCEMSFEDHDEHEGVIRDYPYPGSATRMTWHESDRRNFHGDWPGPCMRGKGPLCTLPAGHRGMCAP